MSRRPHSNRASSSSAAVQPRPARPTPGKRTRTARAYGDVAGAPEAATAGPAAEAGGDRRLNIDYPMLPPEVYAMEQAEGAVSQASTSTGQALPEELADRFSASLGADLSRVRIHTGAESASAARAVGARAYAVGQDVHFAAGQYDPSSAAGQHLLAHEVAHTVQQSGGGEMRQNKLEVSAPGDAHEVEADRAAEAMVAGQATTITASTNGGVSRFWDEVSEFIWGEEQVATKTPAQPAQPAYPAQPAQPAYPAQPAPQEDLEVQRASQDVEYGKQNVAKAEQAAREAVVAWENASIAFNQQHASREEAEQVEKAFVAARQWRDLKEGELSAAQHNLQQLEARLEQAKRDAAARGQAGGQAAAPAGGGESGSFWDSFW
jgi:hypothetical protein